MLKKLILGLAFFCFNKTANADVYKFIFVTNNDRSLNTHVYFWCDQDGAPRPQERDGEVHKYFSIAIPSGQRVDGLIDYLGDLFVLSENPGLAEQITVNTPAVLIGSSIFIFLNQDSVLPRSIRSEIVGNLNLRNAEQLDEFFENGPQLWRSLNTLGSVLRRLKGEASNELSHGEREGIIERYFCFRSPAGQRRPFDCQTLAICTPCINEDTCTNFVNPKDKDPLTSSQYTYCSECRQLRELPVQDHVPGRPGERLEVPVGAGRAAPGVGARAPERVARPVAADVPADAPVREVLAAQAPGIEPRALGRQYHARPVADEAPFVRPAGGAAPDAQAVVAQLGRPAEAAIPAVAALPPVVHPNAGPVAARAPAHLIEAPGRERLAGDAEIAQMFLELERRRAGEHDFLSGQPCITNGCRGLVEIENEYRLCNPCLAEIGALDRLIAPAFGGPGRAGDRLEAPVGAGRAAPAVERPEAAERAAAGAESEQNGCAVCLENEKTHAFLPCGHLICCEACAKKISTTTNKCPNCRADSKGSVRIYKS